MMLDPKKPTSGNRVMPPAYIYCDSVRLAWPRDPTGWIYIGRAVEELGRAMFPEWQHYYPIGLLPDVLVDHNGVDLDDDGHIREIAYAAWLLDVRGEDTDYIYRANDPFAYSEVRSIRSTLEDFTLEEWERAAGASRAEWELGIAARARFSDVSETMTIEAEAGRLIIGSRLSGGGIPAATPKDWWFTDSYQSRFAFGLIDPSAPFTEPPNPIGGLPTAHAHQLFVEAASFKGLISRFTQRDSDLASSSLHLSPYMRLMLKVIEDLDIRPSNQSIKSSIVAEFAQRWEAYGLPPSAKLPEAMATLIREVESQKGRANKG